MEVRSIQFKALSVLIAIAMIAGGSRGLCCLGEGW